MEAATPLVAADLLAALRPVLALVSSAGDPVSPTLREVRDLFLGEVRERAVLRRGDRQRLERTTVRTYEAAWVVVEREGMLDAPATRATAEELLRLVPSGNLNAFGGALSAAYHCAGLGEDVPARALWVYRPPRSVVNLDSYTHAAERAAFGLDLAMSSGRSDSITTAAACFVLVYTGARPREIVQARRSDLEIRGGAARLRLEAKGGERWIPIAPIVLQVLLLVKEGEFLFPGRGKVPHVHPCSLDHALARWEAPAPLVIRRLYASWLIAQGVPITIVSALMGHVSPQTTLRHYARPTSQQQIEAAQMVATAMAGGQMSLPSLLEKQHDEGHDQSTAARGSVDALELRQRTDADRARSSKRRIAAR